MGWMRLANWEGDPKVPGMSAVQKAVDSYNKALSGDQGTGPESPYPWGNEQQQGDYTKAAPWLGSGTNAQTVNRVNEGPASTTAQTGTPTGTSVVTTAPTQQAAKAFNTARGVMGRARGAMEGAIDDAKQGISKMFGGGQQAVQQTGPMDMGKWEDFRKYMAAQGLPITIGPDEYIAKIKAETGKDITFSDYTPKTATAPTAGNPTTAQPGSGDGSKFSKEDIDYWGKVYEQNVPRPKSYTNEDYSNMVAGIMGYTPESADDKRKRERQERLALSMEGIGRGLGALSNLYYTTQWAPSQDLGTSQTYKTFLEERKEKDAKNARWMSEYMRLRREHEKEVNAYDKAKGQFVADMLVQSGRAKNTLEAIKAREKSMKEINEAKGQQASDLLTQKQEGNIKVQQLKNENSTANNIRNNNTSTANNIRNNATSQANAQTRSETAIETANIRAGKGKKGTPNVYAPGGGDSQNSGKNPLPQGNGQTGSSTGGQKKQLKNYKKSK